MHNVNIANGHINRPANVNGWLGASAGNEDVLDDLIIYTRHNDGA